MTAVISLRPHHTEVASINHPLLNGVKAVPEKELDRLAARVAEGASGDELILALRSVLCSLVGRYVYYWPATRPFMDEMVSEGFAAFSALIPQISLDFLCGRGILKVASRRAQDAINTFLNDNQGLASPSLRQQKYRMAKAQDPVYLTAETKVTDEDFEHPIDLGDEALRDVLDALCKIDTIDEIDKFLLDRFNWGRGYQELADELGVGVGTVYRRKTRAYKKYLEIIR